MSEPEGIGETGTALDEPRLQFFLKHRRQIREWAAMADDARGGVAEVLRGLLPDAQVVFRERYGVEVVDRLPGRGDAKLVAYRQEWRAGEPLSPLAVVGLGWTSGKVDPEAFWPGTQLPWVGIHVAKTGAEAIAPLLRERVRDKNHRPPGYVKGLDWITYKTFKASRDWWQDIPAWRTSVIEELATAWGECSPLIDEAFRSVR